jgi:hypothetical protein
MAQRVSGVKASGRIADRPFARADRPPLMASEPLRSACTGAVLAFFSAKRPGLGPRRALNSIQIFQVRPFMTVL